MTTLADFLLARIAEDEKVAQVAEGNDWQEERDAEGKLVIASEEILVARPADPWSGEHIALHDPARVLAECEAKRRIVRTATDDGDCQGHPEPWVPHGDYGPGFCHNYEDNGVLLMLALPYADHPDYREEWRA